MLKPEKHWTHCHQIPAPMQKHPPLSWGNSPLLWRPPKLYEALRNTLCDLIPKTAGLQILDVEIKKAFTDRKELKNSFR